MSDDQDQASFGYGKAWGKVPMKRMAELITLSLVASVGLGGYILHAHSQDTKKEHEATRQVIKEDGAATHALLKEMIGLQKDMLSEQREQTCLQRFADPRERRDNTDFCRRIGRQR